MVVAGKEEQGFAMSNAETVGVPTAEADGNAEWGRTVEQLGTSQVWTLRASGALARGPAFLAGTVHGMMSFPMTAPLRVL